MNYKEELSQMKLKVATFAEDFNPKDIVDALRSSVLVQIAQIARKETDHVFRFYEDIELEDGSLDCGRMPEFDAPCVTTCAIIGGATFGMVGSVEVDDGVMPKFKIYNYYGQPLEVRTEDISLDDLVEILNSMY